MGMDIPAETLVVSRPEAVLWRGERTGRVALLGAATIVLSVIATLGEGEGPQLQMAQAFGALSLPLGALVAGLALIERRRDLASALLFGAVPGAIAVAALVRGSASVDPWLTLMTAGTLIAFVSQAATLISSADGEIAPSPPALGKSAPPRLERRDRIYVGMQLVTLLAFAVPAIMALFSPVKNRLIAVSVALLLGMLACRAFLIDLLARHLQGDEPLRDALAQLRRHARRGKPSGVFYVASLAAIAGMLLFVARGYLAKALP